MLGIESAIPWDNQPIGGHSAATLLGETKLLTDWITPFSIEIQDKYDKLTSGLNSLEDKILTCLRFVASFPYSRFIRVDTRIADKTFTQTDAWLEPAQAIRAPKINCANRAFLLTSLLRQALPADRVFTVFGNLNTDHQDGHAWSYVRLDQDYLLEPTNSPAKVALVPVDITPMYEDIIYLSDAGVVAIPDRALRQPFSDCFHCICWLSDYIDKELCC